MKLHLRIQKEVTLADLEAAALYLDMEIKRVALVDRGSLGGAPPTFELEVSVPDDWVTLGDRGDVVDESEGKAEKSTKKAGQRKVEEGGA